VLSRSVFLQELCCPQLPGPCPSACAATTAPEFLESRRNILCSRVLDRAVSAALSCWHVVENPPSVYRYQLRTIHGCVGTFLNKRSNVTLGRPPRLYIYLRRHIARVQDTHVPRHPEHKHLRLATLCRPL
jgi:hypothetical protein